MSYGTNHVFVILLLITILICVKAYFPLVFYTPTIIFHYVNYRILQLLRKRILQELEDGVVASRKMKLYYKLQRFMLVSEEEIKNGLDRSSKGKEMKSYAAGSTVHYSPVAQGNRESKVPFSVVMSKLSRDEVNRFADDRVSLDKGGRVKSLRNQKVSYDITVAQLRDWKGLEDENGNAINFNAKDKATSYDMLPVEVQEELEAVFGGGGFDATVAERVEREYKKRQKDNAEDDKYLATPSDDASN